MSNRNDPYVSAAAGTILGGGMSKELESNSFQWRNLYLHRFGVCTYAPPMPKDPETTTRGYPTTSNLMRLRQQHGAHVSDPQSLQMHDGDGNSPLSKGGGGGSGAPMRSPTTDALQISAPASAAVEGVITKNVFSTPMSRLAAAGGGGMEGASAGGTGGGGSTHQQRRAELERQKKLQREELMRQNPHGLAASVLRLHQAAWRLIMDDAFLCQSMKLSREYSQLTHVLDVHIRRAPHPSQQYRSGSSRGGAMPPPQSAALMHGQGYRRGPQLVVSSKRASVFSNSVLTDRLQLSNSSHSGNGNGNTFAAEDKDAPFTEQPTLLQLLGSQHQMFQCGPDHILQVPLKDENTTAAALYEFAPFFVAVSAPEEVSAMEQKMKTQRFQTLPDMRTGSSSEIVGYPMFSQFSSWQEAYQRRTEWPHSPFHFFLVHDSSYDFAQCTALLALLELYARNKHLHIPDAMQIAAKALPKDRHKKGPPKLDPVQQRQANRKPASGGVQQTAIVFEPMAGDSPLIEITGAPGGGGEAGNGDSRKKSLFGMNPMKTPEQRHEEQTSARLRLLLALDRAAVTAPKILCSRIACCASQATASAAPPPAASMNNSNSFTRGSVAAASAAASSSPANLPSDGRNPCPLLTFESSTEDLLLVFENSPNRNAFRLLFTMFHFFLQNAMKPGQATRHLLTAKHVFPFEDHDKLVRVVSKMEARMRSMRKQSKRQTRKFTTVGGDMMNSDDDDERSDEEAGNGRSDDDDEDADDLAQAALDADKAAELSVFSELEFNALFHLSAYFVDLGFNTPNLKLRPGGLPTPGCKDEALQFSRLAHIANLQATSTFAEAVVRFEAQTQARAEKKRIVASLAQHVQTSPLNVQRKIRAHQDLLAAEEAKTEAYKDAASLAFPLTLMGAYFRLHGGIWIRQVTSKVVAYLARTDVLLYVTQGMLEDPIAAYRAMIARTNSTTGGSGRKSQSGSAAAPATGATPHAGAHATSSSVSGVVKLMTIQKQLSRDGTGGPSLPSAVASPQASMLFEAEGSMPGFPSGIASPPPNPLSVDLLTEQNSADASLTSLPAGGASSTSQPTPAEAVLPMYYEARASTPHDVSGESIEPDDGKPNNFKGYLPSEQEMFIALEAMEERICTHIETALRLLLVDLDKSHFLQRIPAGISRLTTELCTTVHAQILSGIVLLPPEASASGTPPTGNELVELYISTLLGDKRKGNQASGGAAGGAAATGGKKRAGVTLLVDDSPTVSKPSASTRSDRHAESSSNATSPSQPPPTPSSSERNKRPPPDQESSITLISDIRRYRLAKFVLFDTWLLPALNNALRYNLVDSTASMHLLRNIDALARYVKVVVNGPFAARELERRSSLAELHHSDSISAVGESSSPAAGASFFDLTVGGKKGAAAAAAAAKTIASENEAKARVTVVMQPHISGLYNASTGGLIQLFVPPEDRSGIASDDDSASEGGAASDKSGTGRRSSAGSGAGRRKSRRTSSVSSGDTEMDRSRRKSTRRPSVAGIATAAALTKNARRKSSVKAVSLSAAMPNSSKQLATPMRRFSVAFKTQTDAWWPVIAELSPALYKLNTACGTVSSALPPADDSTAIPNLLNSFCWRTSTCEEPHVMMNEYAVPPSAVAQAVENLHAIATGRHPAVTPKPPATLAVSASLSLGASQSGDFFGSGISDDGSNNGSDNAMSDAGRPVTPVSFEEEEGKAQFLRALHSVLHFPTFASKLLNNINVNNKKLFQYLVRPASSLAATLNHVATLTPAVGSSGTSLSATPPSKWTTPAGGGAGGAAGAVSIAPPLAYSSAKLTDYTHLWTALATLIVHRDMPLVDVNGVLAVVAMTSEQATSRGVLPPPSLVAAYLRLAQQQQFVTTAFPLPLVAPSGGGGGSGGVTVGAAKSGGGGDAAVLAGSAAKAAASCPFHSFYSGLTIALCTKAAAVLEECSQRASDDWTRKCGRHLTRSYNEQMAMQQLTHCTTDVEFGGPFGKKPKVAAGKSGGGGQIDPMASSNAGGMAGAGVNPAKDHAGDGAMLVPSKPTVRGTTAGTPKGAAAGPGAPKGPRRKGGAKAGGMGLAATSAGADATVDPLQALLAQGGRRPDMANRWKRAVGVDVLSSHMAPRRSEVSDDDRD